MMWADPNGGEHVDNDPGWGEYADNDPQGSNPNDEVKEED